MKFTTAVLTTGLAALLAGCAPSRPAPPTPEMVAKQQEERRIALAEAKRTYTGFTKEQIMSAVVKVFDHLDKDDYQARFEDDRVLVSRSSVMVSFLFAQTTRDYWEFKLNDRGERRYEVAIGQDSAAVMSALPSTIPQIYKTDINQPPARIDSRLIHDRIEYFLGTREKWPDCAEYKTFEGKAVIPYPYCAWEWMDDRRPL